MHVLAVTHVAESREESLLLAKQLAAAKADLQKTKTSSSKLSRQLETEQLLRTDAEGAAEALKQRLEKLLNGSKEANKHRTDMAEVGSSCCCSWCCSTCFASCAGIASLVRRSDMLCVRYC